MINVSEIDKSYRTISKLSSLCGIIEGVVYWKWLPSSLVEYLCMEHLTENLINFNVVYVK